MNKSLNQEVFLSFQQAQDASVSLLSPFADWFDIYILTSTSEIPTISYSAPEAWKRYPFGRSLPVYAIIGSTPILGCSCPHSSKVVLKCFEFVWYQFYLGGTIFNYSFVVQTALAAVLLIPCLLWLLTWLISSNRCWATLNISIFHKLNHDLQHGTKWFW